MERQNITNRRNLSFLIIVFFLIIVISRGSFVASILGGCMPRPTHNTPALPTHVMATAVGFLIGIIAPALLQAATFAKADLQLSILYLT